MHLAAIVILNYNGEKMLRQFLPGVCKNSKYPVVVIDNGSSDGSIDFLRAQGEKIQLITLRENLGYAGGYNVGLEVLAGNFKYYLLLNSDVEVSEGWDEPLIQILESQPNAASIQPKILSFQNPTRFDYAGAGGGFLDVLGYPYCRGRIFQEIEDDTSQYDDLIQVDWTSGACMAVRSDLFHSHKGFEDRFFAHMEEVDICWRWRRAGFDCLYTGSVAVLHVGGATLARSSPRKTFLNFRNNLWMLGKNLPISRFLQIYTCRLLLDACAAVVFAMRGSLRDSVSVIKAHGAYLISEKPSKGREIVGDQTVSTMRQTSILYEYYIRRKKKYSRL